MFFSKISEFANKANIILKAVIGSVFITSIEFAFGVIFNILLKKNVWDYSRMPLNICGQICLLYSFVWGLLSIIFIPFAEYLKKKL